MLQPKALGYINTADLSVSVSNLYIHTIRDLYDLDLCHQTTLLNIAQFTIEDGYASCADVSEKNKFLLKCMATCLISVSHIVNPALQLKTPGIYNSSFSINPFMVGIFL